MARTTPRRRGGHDARSRTSSGPRRSWVARLDEIRQLKDRLEDENLFLRTEMRHQAGFPGIVGRSVALRDVLAKVAQVAPTDSAVLLLGEMGTGKDLLAHAIHDLSPRRKGPHIKVACALPPNLIESELFGHEKGASTGATGSRTGRFGLADGGTLFVDEIGELAVELQVKLLLVLQEGAFERVGSNQPARRTCGSWPQPTATSNGPCGWAVSARASTTA